MDKNYEVKSGELNALPVEELFVETEYKNPYELIVDLCIEHGRVCALKDYIKAVNEKNYLTAMDVKAILGMIGEEEDE